MRTQREREIEDQCGSSWEATVTGKREREVGGGKGEADLTRVRDGLQNSSGGTCKYVDTEA